MLNTMPELPEVETTLNGIAPYLCGQRVKALTIRERRLRWPVPENLEQDVRGQTVRRMSRRGKYILVELDQGGMLIHLGMSGSMRVLPNVVAPALHDHFDIETGSGNLIRFRDPRRFGCLLWHPHDVRQHPRLLGLGVEPLSPAFTVDILLGAANNRRVPIKTLIMDGAVVVGVGNIYASESLFDAGIHPHRACNRVSERRLSSLVVSIRKILRKSIRQGGTTLRDFVGADGEQGYFEQQLSVYGREGEPCLRCDGVIRKTVTAQRATYYCPGCQR